MRTLPFFFLLVITTYANTGFDAIVAISTSQMTCMKQHGYSRFIGRVYRSNGLVDQQGIKNIRNAITAEIPRVDGYIFPCSSANCKSPALQVEDVSNALKSAGISIGMLWLDIENHKWQSSHIANRKFITEMANELTKWGYNWGIYSSYVNWQAIVGLDWTDLQNKPLWWAKYNGKANFDNFQSFGGWLKPTIHQYKGNVNSPCFFNVDLSWYQ